MKKLVEAPGLAFAPELLSPIFNGLPIESASSCRPNLSIDRAVISRTRQTEADRVRGYPSLLPAPAMALAV